MIYFTIIGMLVVAGISEAMLMLAGLIAVLFIAGVVREYRFRHYFCMRQTDLRSACINAWRDLGNDENISCQGRVFPLFKKSYWRD